MDHKPVFLSSFLMNTVKRLTTLIAGEMVEEGKESCGKWLRERCQFLIGHVLDTVANENWQKAMVRRSTSGINNVVQLGIALQMDD